MTEGIIQKVYGNASIKILEEHKDMIYDSKDTFYLNLIEKTMQELIEEIKKEFPITNPFCHVINYNNLQKKLIGDSQ